MRNIEYKKQQNFNKKEYYCVEKKILKNDWILQIFYSTSITNLEEKYYWWDMGRQYLMFYNKWQIEEMLHILKKHKFFILLYNCSLEKKMN